MATLYTESDLQDVILYCPNEDLTYPSPEIMEDENHNRLYAYVTLVMRGDRYTSAAIVLAESLRELNTKADLVVLITPDVSDEAEKILGTYFDKVKRVSYIEVTNWRTKKQKHRMYLNYVFTKFHLFDLIEYKKVLLIDADAIVLKYPDHLFTLKAPAGCYIADKDLMITYDAQGNYVLPSNKQIRWYNEMCDCCAHGKLIPRHYTDKVLQHKNNSGIGGGLNLLEPKEGELKSILDDVTHGKMKNLVNNFFVWPEQQYLTARYSSKWHSINPRFFGLQGYPHWNVLYGLQYGGDKPFMLDSKMDISQRIQYPDFVLWHDLFSKILKDHPEFNNLKVLRESIQMNQYFHTKVKTNRLKRLENTNVKQTISDKLHINIKYIYDNHIKYYHLNPNVVHIPQHVKQLFYNVKPYDYTDVITRLHNYYKNTKSNYYDDLLTSIKSKKQYDNMLEISEHSDQIILDYIKCRPESFIITIWPLGINCKDSIVDYLKTKGNVYYVKEIELTYNATRNLMFNMYDEFSKNDKARFIDAKLEYVHAKQNINNKICVIVFDNVQNHRLSGQGSPFKRELRNFLVNTIQKTNKIENIRGNDVIHINDHFYQTIEYAQLLLNDNSLFMLQHQNFDNINSKYFESSQLKYQSLRKYLYENFSLLEMDRLCLMGGSIFYSFGIRVFNDLDGVILNINETEKDFEHLVKVNLYNKDTRIRFADIGIIDSKEAWREKLTIKNNELLKQINIKSFDDIILNPAYHYYYNGIKMYIKDFELMRKLDRMNIKDYADFIVQYFKYNFMVNDVAYLDTNNKLQFKKPYNKERICYKGNFNKEVYEVMVQMYGKITIDNIDINDKLIHALLD